MLIRRAADADLDAVEKLYDEIHTAEEAGILTTGWIRNVYPVRDTAQTALKRNDLFVLEESGQICGAGIINNMQADCYRRVKWKYDALDAQVCVLHTLVISPAHAGKGYGSAFLEFYEQYARETGCAALRMDTNVKNKTARNLYRKRGYEEAGVVPTCFQGIPNVQLVLLEKRLMI